MRPECDLSPIWCEDDPYIIVVIINIININNNKSTTFSCCVSMVPLLFLLLSFFSLVQGKGEQFSFTLCLESIGEH